MIQHSKALTNF